MSYLKCIDNTMIHNKKPIIRNTFAVNENKYIEQEIEPTITKK